MSYKYETQYNSPNYTPASRAQATWGQPRTIKAIAIHWWGDPNTGPTYEGVIATLCNPNRGASAHYVATGTGRRVACLVSPADASWATNSANPWTISIECDPRCREEDYDVVAELIASIRSAYGDLPLVPHKQFVATACPGNYNLGELDRRARLKDGSGDWGDVKNINGGPTVAIIQNADNWRGRVNRSFNTIRGRNMSEQEFQNFVGKDTLTLMEALQDDPAADEQMNFATLGRQAQAENLRGQVNDLKAEKDAKQAKIDEQAAEVEKLKAELASKGTESPSNGSGNGNGTTNPSTPETPSQTLWEWLAEIFSKFKRSK